MKSVVSSSRLESKGAPLTTPMRAEVEQGKRMGKRAKTTIEPKKKLIAIPVEKRRGRQSIKASMTPAEIAKEVKELIDDLKGAKDVDEKKRIRRALRLRGHYGGLGKAVTKAVTKTTSSTPKATPVAA